MAQLIVRNIDEAIVKALKLRAVRNGRSAEEEHRAILRTALLGRPRASLKEHLLAIPDVGEDDDFAPSRGPARRVDF